MKEETVLVWVRLTKKQKEEYKLKCQREKRSMANQMQVLVDNFLKEKPYN